MKKSVLHYLQNYGHRFSRSVGNLVTASYANVLILPAFDESATLLQQVLPSDAENLLLILVVNAPAGLPAASPALERTRQLWDALTETVVWKGGADRIRWGSLSRARKIDLLCIDCLSPGPGMPPAGGVGAARRIAADCALALIEQRRIASHWIHCTDADARLPRHYFTATAAIDCCSADGNPAAVIYPFHHFSETESLLDLATYYELQLRYYIERLSYIGSPYAFHALGSTLAVQANAYAAVRGFPCRSAAEDFYLLNKLVKTNPIICLPGPTIRIEARLSQRVPFGTGPALERLAVQKFPVSYSPACFPPLGAFYQSLRELDYVPSHAADWLPDSVRELFAKMGFESLCEKLAKQGSNPRRFKQGCLEWFDGFRLVRYLNLCRDQGIIDEPLLVTTRRLYHKPDATVRQLNDWLFERETRHSRTRGLKSWLRQS